MPHDFKAFPELTNNQMQFYYGQSPHKQITESFTAEVVKVHDGDTITVAWQERDFTFPVRFSNVAAPELNEAGGHEAQSWLEGRLLGTVVDIEVNPDKRVEKWGRILGKVLQGGIDVGEEEVYNGYAKTWDQSNDGKIIDPVKRAE